MSVTSVNYILRDAVDTSVDITARPMASLLAQQIPSMANSSTATVGHEVKSIDVALGIGKI